MLIMQGSGGKYVLTVVDCLFAMVDNICLQW